MSETIEVIPGSGNVFADLGLPNSDEELMKAKLVKAIGEKIARLKLTHEEAARFMEIAPLEVSALLRGGWGGYTLERLLRFLSAMGSDVDISITDRQDGGKGRMTVVA